MFDYYRIIRTRYNTGEEAKLKSTEGVDGEGGSRRYGTVSRTDHRIICGIYISIYKNDRRLYPRSSSIPFARAHHVFVIVSRGTRGCGSEGQRRARVPCARDRRHREKRERRTMTLPNERAAAAAAAVQPRVCTRIRICTAAGKLFCTRVRDIKNTFSHPRPRRRATESEGNVNPVSRSEKRACTRARHPAKEDNFRDGRLANLKIQIEDARGCVLSFSVYPMLSALLHFC